DRVRARRLPTRHARARRVRARRDRAERFATPGGSGRRREAGGVVSFGAIVLLAIGPAMDATAVSAARGLALPAHRVRPVLPVAVFFGGFQALMPVVGWLLGARIGPLVQAWDHWIAFGLLTFIGGKMLWEARGAAGDDDERTVDHFALRTMLVLAIATSIDAL